jgi:hypothetical protein
VSDTEYLVTFVVMLVISILTVRLRQQAEAPGNGSKGVLGAHPADPESLVTPERLHFWKPSPTRSPWPWSEVE